MTIKDTVERLRKWARDLSGTHSSSFEKDIAEEFVRNAALIERLAGALEEIEGLIPKAEMDYSHKVWGIARRALSGEPT